MITELTPEQERLLDEYAEEGIRIALSTERVKEDDVPSVADYLASQLKEKRPDTSLHRGPVDAWKRVKKIYGVEGPMEFIIPGYEGCVFSYLSMWGLYYHRVLGISIEGIEEFHDAITRSSYVFCTEKEYVFMDRPEILAVQDRQLHSESGPAVQYGDGYKDWYIRGIRVDEQIVTDPAAQTVDQILTESNADVRSIRIERFGWLPFIDKIGAKKIDERDNVVEGTLEQLYHARKAGVRVYVAVDPSSPSPVCIPVPDEIHSCREARIWMDGGVEYNVLGRT